MKQEHDPDGLPINNRQMSKQADEVQPTSAGIVPTSPTPMSGKPSGFIVGSTAPGHSEAPTIATEGTKPTRTNSIPEYRPSVVSRLPDSISAREIYEDDSNADGRIANRVQR